MFILVFLFLKPVNVEVSVRQKIQILPALIKQTTVRIKMISPESKAIAVRKDVCTSTNNSQYLRIYISQSKWKVRYLVFVRNF